MLPQRRSPPLPEVQEEPFDSQSQGDVIYQLGDKIRMQAKRLSTLEQYKIICERRIGELCPGHEIPVKVEHLGTRLEYSSLLSENQSLKDSLRQEVLSSEKQRAYIESLKQALESRSKDHSFDGQPSSPRLAFSKDAGSDSYRKDREKCRELEERLSGKMREIEEMREERDALVGELEEIRETLQQMQQSCQALESDKSSLIALAEASRRAPPPLSIEPLQSELLSAQSQIARLTSDLKVALEGKEKQGEYAKNREIADAKLVISQLQSSLDIARSRINELSTQNQSMTDQVFTFQSSVESIQDRLNHTQTELKSTKQELDYCKSDLESANSQRNFMQEALRTVKEQMAEKESCEGRYKGEIRSLQLMVTGLREENEKNERVNTGKIEEMSKAITLSERKSTDWESAYHKKVTELTADRNAIQSKYDTELRQFESALSLLESEAQSAKSDASTRIKSSESDIQRLNLRIRELQENLKAEKLAKEQVESDFRLYQSRSTVLTEEKSTLSQEISEMQTEITASKALNAKLQQTIRAITEEKHDMAKRMETTGIEQERMEMLVKTMAGENEELKGSLDALQGDLETISENVVRNNEELNSVRDALRVVKGREQDQSHELSSLLTYVKSKVSSLSILQSIATETNERTLLQHLSSVFSCIETVQGDVVALQNEGEGLKAALSSARAEIDNAKSSLSESLKTEAEYREQVALLNHQLHLLQSQLDQTHTSASDHISRLSSELTTFQREAHRLSSQLQHLSEQHSTAEQDIIAQTDTISRLKGQIKAGEEAITAICKEKRELESLFAKVISAIPTPRVKSLAIGMLQTRSEILVYEQSLLQSRVKIADMESQLSYLQDTKETLALHKEIQRESDSQAETEHTLESYRRKMQALEGEIIEAQENEAGRIEDGERLGGIVEELQERLDRKTAELTQARYEMLRTQRKETIGGAVAENRTSPRSQQPPTVYARLEQARATITELKKLSRSGI